MITSKLVFCRLQVFSAGKQHFAGIRGNCKECSLVPEEVKVSGILFEPVFLL